MMMCLFLTFIAIPDIELLSADIHLRHYRSRLILYYRPPSALADELHSLAGFLQSILPQCGYHLSYSLLPQR